MKKNIFILLVLFCGSISAQNVWIGARPDSISDSMNRDSLHWEHATRLRLIVDDMQNATVYQDSAIYKLLDRTVNGSEQQVAEIDGYRVQIYSSNQQQQAKQEALELEQRIKSKIEEPIYVQYATPFWKVRIGNFRTLADASAFKEEFLRSFPKLQSSTYVVRDRIEVKL